MIRRSKDQRHQRARHAAALPRARARLVRRPPRPLLSGSLQPHCLSAWALPCSMTMAATRLGTLATATHQVAMQVRGATPAVACGMLHCAVTRAAHSAAFQSMHLVSVAAFLCGGQPLWTCPRGCGRTPSAAAGPRVPCLPGRPPPPTRPPTRPPTLGSHKHQTTPILAIQVSKAQAPVFPGTPAPALPPSDLLVPLLFSGAPQPGGAELDSTGQGPSRAGRALGLAAAAVRL